MSNELWLNVNGVFTRTNITEEKLAGMIVENNTLKAVTEENERLVHEWQNVTKRRVQMETKMNKVLTVIVEQFGDNLKGMLT